MKKQKRAFARSLILILVGTTECIESALRGSMPPLLDYRPCVLGFLGRLAPRLHALR